MKLPSLSFERIVPPRWWRAAICIFLAGMIAEMQAQPAIPPGKARRAQGELIVKFRAGVTDAEIENIVRGGQLKMARHVRSAVMARRNHRGLTLVKSELERGAAMEQLKRLPGVEYVEENLVYRHRAVSNDPFVTANYTWGVYGDRSMPTNSFGSQAAEAWMDGYVGANDIYVAVIDEGIDVSHPDLAPNIWNNPFDPADGIDNDGNGYVDDIHGWDFYGDQNKVYTEGEDTHGTHVAGTIGAKGGNGVGIAGVNWNVTLLPGKFLGPEGGTTLDAVEAVDYFVDLKERHHLNIVAINASWGGEGYSQSLHDAVIRAAKAGILFVAAAGNDGLNNDTIATHPSNLDTRIGTSTESAASYDAVISVAAIDSAGALASFSNYGAANVDIGAPGVDVLSTYPGNYLAYLDGTSMAAPHVTGAIALYFSTHPDATPASVREAILGTVIATPSLSEKTSTGGRLDLSAVIAPGLPAPSWVVAVPGNGHVALKWNAVEGASGYIVKRSTLSGGPYSVVASNVQSLNYSDQYLANGATYYFVVASMADGRIGADSAEVPARPIAPPPPAPTGVAGNASGSTVDGWSVVTLRWNSNRAASSFKVKRGTSARGPFILVAAEVKETTFTESVAANGGTYYYTVRAVNATGEGSDSAAISVFPVPPTPGNLRASAVSSSQVLLTWVDQTVDEKTFEIDYWNGSAFVRLGTKGANTSAATIGRISSGKTHYFRVRAHNESQSTDYSNIASVILP